MTEFRRHQPRRRFGQNFLHDPRVITRIVDAISPRPGERIVEIGPGQAALTRPLIERAGHVTALEIDRDLARDLCDEFDAEKLTLVVGDALDFDWSVIEGALRIVGNLPYNISSPLLFALLPLADRVIDQHFMLQKEVVERMVAAPGSRTYGRLSAMLQYRYRLTKLFDVPRGAFRPPPEVTSSIVRMEPLSAGERPHADPIRYAKVVAAAFGQRRKTLRNALANMLDADQIAAAGINPQARAETLSVHDFARLSAAIRAD
jgi:16S rRNA (adenine1518-N6/adenine1519-N6)-dimethyltransferase